MKSNMKNNAKKNPYANNVAGKSEAIHTQPQPSAKVIKAKDGADLRSVGAGKKVTK
jgi:hypothetical protein